MTWKRFLAWCSLADRYPYVPWVARNGQQVRRYPGQLEKMMEELGQ